MCTQDLLSNIVLHISLQRLPPGCGGLALDGDTLAALSPHLRVLCAAGCWVTEASLCALAGLTNLRQLDLAGSAISDMSALTGRVLKKQPFSMLCRHQHAFGPVLCHRLTVLPTC